MTNQHTHTPTHTHLLHTITYIILVKSFIFRIFHILVFLLPCFFCFLFSQLFLRRAFACFIFHGSTDRRRRQQQPRKTETETVEEVREEGQAWQTLGRTRTPRAHSLLCNIFTLFYYKSTKCTQRCCWKVAKVDVDVSGCCRFCFCCAASNFCRWQQKHIKRHKMHGQRKVDVDVDCCVGCWARTAALLPFIIYFYLN